LPRPAGELVQLQCQQQIFISLKTLEAFTFVGEFGRVLEPAADQAVVDQLPVCTDLVVGL
jgi:hypothetical protein